MADLSLKKKEMKAAIKSLKSQIETFSQTTKSMDKNVDTLCDNWTAQASSVYRTDYKTLTSNFSKTVAVVEKLIKSTEKYMDDMDKLDAAYSKSKVKEG